MNNYFMILNAWQDKIPSESVFGLQKQLETQLKDADENALSQLSMIQLKDPIIGLVLGLFLGVFGADRFYKGDIGLGVAKLILTLTIFGIIISWVWAIVDYFLVWQGIKRDNFQKIMLNLSFIRS